MSHSHSLIYTIPAPRRALACGGAQTLPGHAAVLRDWLFCASFRLTDESKPIVLRLVVEAMIAGHALMLWMRRSTTRGERCRRSARTPSRRRQSRVTIERRAGIYAPCAFSGKSGMPVGSATFTGHTQALLSAPRPMILLENEHAPRYSIIASH